MTKKRTLLLIYRELNILCVKYSLYSPYGDDVIIQDGASNGCHIPITILCFRRHFRRCLLEIHGKFCRLDVYKVLDLFYNNKPTLVKAMVNVPGVSDHDAIVADCDIKPAFCKKKPRTVFLFSEANWSPSQNALLRLSLP